MGKKKGDRVKKKARNKIHTVGLSVRGTPLVSPCFFSLYCQLGNLAYHGVPL